MRDTMRMRFSQRIAYLQRHRERFPQVQWPILNSRRERFPLRVLHDDEIAFPVFTNFVNGADIWMVQHCRGSCFSNQAFLSPLISN